MCLGVPMQVRSIDGLIAHCEARGVERSASLLMFQHEDVQVGDNVMVHLGHVIQKLSEEEARLSWETYDELFEALDNPDQDSSTA